jgi:protein-histidine pros-kinase
MTINYKLLSKLKKWISPPKFAIEEKTRIARLLNTISLAVMFVAIIYVVFSLLQTPIQMYRFLNAIISFSIALLTFILIRLEYVKQASIFIIIAALVFTTGVTAITGGVSAPFTVSYILTLLIAGMLLGKSGEFVFGALCLLSLFGIYQMDLGSYLPQSVVVYTKTSLWLLKSLMFIVVAVILRLATNSISSGREALKKNLKRFEGLLESDPDGVMVINEMGNVELVNKKFENLFGYTRNEVIGKPVDMFIPSRFSKHAKQVDKFMKTPVIRPMYSDLEIFALRKDGNEFPADISLGPLKTDSGVVVFASIRDITDRKKVENELAKHRENLEELVDERTSELNESNSLKELLLDIIAHDLKNPAGVIKGFADFGRETDPDNEILQEIQIGTNSLLKVIDNTTVLSKVATGDEIDKEAIDITEMITAISKEFAAQLQFANMKLDLNIKEQMMVTANPIISEVFRNYISNAIKYASSGEKIIIDMQEQNGILTVNVIDQGDTIAEKEQDNIFNRSVQLGKTKGSGLGLAIVKRIAIAHDAEVGVKPNKPKGNIFYIKLPVV